jgi:hypothetical protein
MVHRESCRLHDDGESESAERFEIDLHWFPAHGMPLQERAQRYKQLRRALDRFHESLGGHAEHEDPDEHSA